MKLNKMELQKAVGYVVYMQMASYFNVKPEFDKKSMEEQYCVFYKLMPSKKQYLMEDISDKYVRKILKHLPKELLSMRSECVFQEGCTKNSEEAVKVIFSTWKYDFYIVAQSNFSGRLKFEYGIEKYEESNTPNGGCKEKYRAA